MSLHFVLVLHSHLPWVLHHGRWPHGSDWLSEAVIETYLPLLASLERAEAAGRPMPITLGVTPVLAAMLAHPSCRAEVDHYFAHRRETIADAPEALAATDELHLLPVVEFWGAHLATLEALWQRIGGNILGELRRHMEAGRIELISSAATHGFLPLLARDESIRFQLLVGRAEHRRHFGVLPTGCWAPECAYRPAGWWQPLPTARRTLRTGIEDHLRYAGFRWFVVDAHLPDAGEAWELYEGIARRRTTAAPSRSPYRAYQVGDAVRGHPVHVVVRDPQATAQVWSRHGGYPGDGRYLEFHKIRYPGGLKLWRVTDSSADLGDKLPYDADRAQEAVRLHATHFRALLDATAAARQQGDGAVVAPFDTELFGHWWFEGVDFLDAVYAGLAGDPVVTPTTATTWLRDEPPTTSVRMGPGSWGANGDFSKWLNPETEWTWERLWPLEERFWNAVPSALARPEVAMILEQAARELLLAQGSDWQFIISTGAAGDYATKRFVQHCEALEALLPALEQPHLDPAPFRARAAAFFTQDDCFTDLLGALAAASDVAVA
ncbi:MAG TPA: 1,4-alpha-glucan branching protein domain-containing protein [Gemmatimonadales bacterium]|nr:1,4-alpha-glucan branching protein domain-containing protein [Gemmatimonadales bacterium]